MLPLKHTYFFWLGAAWVKSRAERPSVSEVNRLFFFALCCLGKIPGGAPFSQLHQRSKQATAYTNRIQIFNYRTRLQFVQSDCRTAGKRIDIWTANLYLKHAKTSSQLKNEFLKQRFVTIHQKTVRDVNQCHSSSKQLKLLGSKFLVSQINNA